jgi:Ca-activated chloride channel family protein
VIRLPIVVAAVLFGLIQEAPRPFRAGVEVVRVNVLVTDGNRPVAGLTAADFVLRDRNVLQQVESVEIADVPISMALVLDTSESVKGATLAQLKSAANAAIDGLGATDHAQLLTFNSAVHRRAEWTSSTPRIREALQLTQAGGGTSLYDAAFAALIDDDGASGNRQLILLFSDGNDTSSWLPPSAVLERAKRSDAVVYTVVAGARSRSSNLFRRSGVELLEPRVPPSKVTPFLTDLSNTTGGASLVESVDGLQRIFARVVGEFRTRYLLTYTPRGIEASGWHPIDVKLKHKKGNVSARRGYLR